MKISMSDTDKVIYPWKKEKIKNFGPPRFTASQRGSEFYFELFVSVMRKWLVTL